MKHHRKGMIALLGALAFSCASPGTADVQKLDPAFQQYVLSAVPADVPNPTFVDFGGKVHLVGYELSPSGGVAAPGSTLTVKLYWRSVKQVARGVHLYTHLTEPNGKVHEFDDVGPLRETVSDTQLGKVPRLPPSAWTPGMVYVDEQTFAVPNVEVPKLTLSVGLKSEKYARDAGELEKVGDFKLAVLSGVSDGKEGALLARFSTGIGRGKPPKDKDGRRRPGIRPGSDRRQGLPLGRGPLGRVPGSDKENPQ
jgi:hypothetical protein